MSSVFEKYRSKVYPYQFEVDFHIGVIAGGTPTDPKVAEAWLRTKIADSDDLIRQAVAEVMVDRNVNADEATEIVNLNKHLNGFRRDENGLYIGGFQLKAGIKEAANIAWPKRRWGPSNKGTMGFFAEHVFIVDDRLYLGVNEPSGVAQRFVHTWRGNGIQYEEYVEDAKLTAHIETDYEFPDEEWATLWLTGEQQGIGATRSQGYGRYQVTRWERV